MFKHLRYKLFKYRIIIFDNVNKIQCSNIFK